MLSAYPVISQPEFREAGRALQHAYDASPEVAEWIDLRCTCKEISIRQKREKRQEPCRQEVSVIADEECEEVEAIEQEDEGSLLRMPCVPPEHLFIDYSIVLSQTYQVPVLWFSSPSLPATRVDALDRVYEAIVLPSSRIGLRQVGVLGGISIAEHPISGLPAFFIHPCRTQEALEVVRPARDINPLEYIMLWFGVIGAPVGLSIPSVVAKSVSVPVDSNFHYVATLEHDDEDSAGL